MTDFFSITPPPELVEQWLSEPRYSSLPKDGTFVVKQCRSLADDEISNLVTKAARWGADQELEACMEWLEDPIFNVDTYKLHADRRPKPPSLKEQALAVVKNSAICDHLTPEHEAILRRALEALPND